jgi:Ca2+-binding RTX toxin-like protein
MANIIPEDLRLIIVNQPGENFTGANYLTLTAEGKVTGPNGELGGEDIDLDKIAADFKTKLNDTLTDEDSFQIPEALLRNSPRSSANITAVPVESLTSTLITDLGKTKVFTNESQRQSFFEMITAASLGAEQNSFFEADDAKNFIEIEAVDAAQLGGLRAWGGDDLILGTDTDIVNGHDGKDIVNGKAGNDKIAGAGGNDLLQGGQGNDLIAGGEGDDLLLGNKGKDELFGGAGKDLIGGGKGADILIGNAGDDILIGRNDGDFLMGDAGEDKFILRADADTWTNNAALADRIADFTLGVDSIKIAYFDGTLTMPEISFVSVDVNLDGTQDTAILCSDRVSKGVVGVMLGIDATQPNLQSSISMVDPKDTALSSIGDHFFF